MFQLFFALFAALLVSCAGTPPKAETNQAKPKPKTHAQSQTQTAATLIVRDTIVDTLKIKDSIFVRETESFKALQKTIDSLIAKRETAKAIDLLKKQVHYYNNLDQLGFRTLQLANLLYQTGQEAEALAILEGFAVYKPAINFWIDSANGLYDKITKKHKEEAAQQISPEKLEIINSLTAQIRNLKITNANPILITDLADSLRSMHPSDSVLTWLEKQVPSQTESSDSYCEEQRKFAAENFANSKKNKAKAKAFLTEAIEALDKCLARTPSANMKKKVVQNREILANELKSN